MIWRKKNKGFDVPFFMFMNASFMKQIKMFDVCLYYQFHSR